MRNPPQIVIELDASRRLPFFAPGARVEFCDADRSNPHEFDERPRRASIEIPLTSRRVGSRRGLACRRREPPRGCEASTGALRIRGRVADRGCASRRGDGTVSCRLTAFAYPPVIVERMVRGIVPAQLRKVRRDFFQRMSDRALKRDLQLYLLLRLRLSRRCGSDCREQLRETSAWATFVEVERRRMLRRLRGAVRRLGARVLRRP